MDDCEDGHYVKDSAEKIDYSKRANEFTVSCILKMCNKTGALFIPQDLNTTLYGISNLINVSLPDGDFNNKVDILMKIMFSDCFGCELVINGNRQTLDIFFRLLSKTLTDDPNWKWAWLMHHFFKSNLLADFDLSDICETYKSYNGCMDK